MNARSEIVDEADQLGGGELMTLDGSLAIEMNRVEIDQQIATARRYPRQISRVASNIKSLVTLDEETAEECMFALPRGGKPIKGPSIRFAEVVKATYGNNRSASRVIAVDRIEKVVIAEGVFHDLETNTATRSETRRRIVDSKGRLYNDDMIIMTGNAAGSIALRNAILGGVPKALWRGAYSAVQSLIAGDIKTLAETREKAIRALATFGVTPEQVFEAVGLAGLEDIKLDHIPVLRGMFSALKNGEETVETMFSKPTTSAPAANTSLTDRLKAQQQAGASGEGFTSTQAEVGAADKPADLDAALDNDQVPTDGGGDAAKEATPGADDTFPGDRTKNAAPPEGEAGSKSEAEKSPLAERIAAFKARVDAAETAVKVLQERGFAAKGLFPDVDRGDPDETGTSAELESYVNARCLEIAAAEQAGS